MKILNKNRLAENISKRIENDVQKQNVGAVEVLIAQHGEILYNQRFGYAQKDSIYRLASMTKPVTTVATLIAIEKGLLHLEDPVEKYYPEYANLKVGVWNEQHELIQTKPAIIKPTLFHILTHTSGICGGNQEEDGYLAKMTLEEKVNLQTAAAYYHKIPLGFEPGTDQQYSPVAAFDVLAAIIEKVSGLTYDQYIKQEILDPCNMLSTAFVPDEEQRQRLIPIHGFENGKAIEIRYDDRCIFYDMPWSHYLGGGGLISTTTDYWKFAEMLRNYGCINGKQLLSEESIRLMTSPKLEKCCIVEEGYDFALGGCVVSDKHPILPQGYYGWGGAYGTCFRVDYKNDMTIIYMKNSRSLDFPELDTFTNLEEDIYTSFE